MANILYLVHRIPYPPDKGDKVRSYHLLRHLVARGHQVFLGTFVDDPADRVHVDTLRAMCADVCAVPLRPVLAKLRSLVALVQGTPLTLRYYDNAMLHQWVRRTVSAQPQSACIVFSSSMAQYAPKSSALPMLLDLVDVDSAKWADFADAHAWPLSWMYRREAALLLGYERKAVSRAARAFLVTENEVALFDRLAPECRGHVAALSNGVDSDHFVPNEVSTSPFSPSEIPVVFTGAMDYWPNIDAVAWFVQSMLPELRLRWPTLRFHIVGRNPTAAVRALKGDAVSVSGTVPDVRPYLQHAAVVTAPLRLARGVQNKVLEAMAMGRPVVCAAACAQAIGAQPGIHLCAAQDASDYVTSISKLVAEPDAAGSIGEAGRRFVVDRYSWEARLAPLDKILEWLERGPIPGGP